MGPRHRSTKKDARRSYPFLFVGQGSARADELAPLVVFRSKVPRSASVRLAARAPAVLQRGVEIGSRWLRLHSDERYVAGDAAYRTVAAALERWILEVHQERAVALFFVPSEQAGSSKHGAWHAWSVARFDDLGRAVITQLRTDGEHDHAQWILRNFLASGAMPDAHDVRQFAVAEPLDDLGARNRRCVQIIRLMKRDGRKALDAVGPLAELAFWACAATSEYLTNPEAFPAHLQRLLRACKNIRPPRALQGLLSDTAARMLCNELPLAVAIAFPPKRARERPTAPTIAAAQKLLLAYFRSDAPRTRVAIGNLLFTFGEPGRFAVARHARLLEEILTAMKRDRALLDSDLIENVIRVLNNSGRGAEALSWIERAEAFGVDLGPEAYLNMTCGASLSRDAGTMAKAAAHIERMKKGNRARSLAAAGVFDNTAGLHVLLGNKPKAIEYIALCKKHGYAAFAQMPKMPEYASLEHDPGFKRLFR